VLGSFVINSLANYLAFKQVFIWVRHTCHILSQSTLHTKFDTGSRYGSWHPVYKATAPAVSVVYLEIWALLANSGEVENGHQSSCVRFGSNKTVAVHCDTRF